jgi:hypothetical protein
MELLKGAISKPYSQNIRLDYKGLLGKNSLAFLKSSSVTKKESFITVTSGVKVFFLMLQTNKLVHFSLFSLYACPIFWGQLPTLEGRKYFSLVSLSET